MKAISETSNYLDSPLLSFVIGRKWRIVRHSLLILVFANIFLRPNAGVKIEDSEVGHMGAEISLYISLCFFVLFLSIVYLNIYFLVPRFLVKGKYFAYLLIITGIITGFFAVVYLADTFYLAERYPADQHLRLSLNDFIGFSFILWLIIAAVTGIRLFQLWIVGSYRINQLEKYNLQSELAGLKSQINPHFLFNSLNNLNVLIQKDKDKATQMLLKLSDLLRYQLYDSAQEKIRLTSDITFLENLLNLEKIRRSRFEYSIEVKGEINGIILPPFLFIPFVENAIKHNVDLAGISTIQMVFEIRNRQLYYECVNSKPALAIAQNKKEGIGLNNIKRRLELLYPGSHILKINELSDKFIINLMIPL